MTKKHGIGGSITGLVRISDPLTGDVSATPESKSLLGRTTGAMPLSSVSSQAPRKTPCQKPVGKLQTAGRSGESKILVEEEESGDARVDPVVVK
jgi:hypothetical protein